MAPDHGAPSRRAGDNRSRSALALAAGCLAALLALAVAGGSQAARRAIDPWQTQAGAWVWHAQPRTGASARTAVIRKRTWLSGFRITEYYPAPEAWALGRRVRTPGLASKHRIDWLYSGLGLSMEGTGIGTDGRFYHIENLGRGGWLTRSGQPTFDGVNDNGPPYWRKGGYWRNRKGGVSFPLLSGGWSNGIGGRWVPPPAGISFAPGPGVPGLRYYRTIAVDPGLIPLGSRVYIPYYKTVPGATGWFVARDTGGAVNGRHIDVYRPPPDVVDDLGRYLTRQKVLIVPPGA